MVGAWMFAPDIYLKACEELGVALTGTGGGGSSNADPVRPCGRLIYCDGADQLPPAEEILVLVDKSVTA